MEDDYEAQWDIDAIMRAEKIKNDPERIKAAKLFAKEQAKKMTEFADSESDMEKGYTSMGKLDLG